jgi:hypothetical protein
MASQHLKSGPYRPFSRLLRCTILQERQSITHELSSNGQHHRMMQCGGQVCMHASNQHQQKPQSSCLGPALSLRRGCNGPQHHMDTTRLRVPAVDGLHHQWPRPPADTTARPLRYTNPSYFTSAHLLLIASITNGPIHLLAYSFHSGSSPGGLSLPRLQGSSSTM